MKNMTSTKVANIIKKNKSNRIGHSVIRRIFRIIIWILMILVFVYSAYKYNMIPSIIPNLIPQNFNPLSYIKVVTEENRIGQEGKKEKDGAAGISSYNFEYKYWAISYAKAEDSQTENVAADEKKESEKETGEETSRKEYVYPADGKIGSGFGDRTHPIKGNVEFHKGVDIEANMGTPIKAFYKGEVVFTGFESTFGNYIRISHDGGLISLYAHCSKILAKKGQKVGTGEIIGKVGSTGSAIGPHLHFEIHQNNVAVDPLKFLPKK